ncbi:helix-turn-helix domain-containing protein [Lactobacillus delbrueckii subsp. lactis]|uniref:Helix-turn-helix domain-containing protein n=1 Tax=Lactobacillus leichmannii TaxID=28039 RepID=A0ABT1XYD3_LACLE|nr:MULTISPECIES: helix-turn-helix transcriptional regulator [Lactobacillus]APG68032.1 peptidoglycan-binding protein LysM [Lactobacillus delbrueckii subsp. lactis]APG75288.1 peptidoglycan-binding protein LysM [Lactobacillus delbrueckii subsp. sunkii]KNE73616.1 peptidoglycan-binding protein LysM [Lactobacillus delbrueckii subsp. sunkii]MCD5448250.1 helix-turn-helix domain-containing protein [Lactobacillus delbrueckii subsp. lactis]MCD5490397.1 helix-turn-helix domain-containing protein [Lactobac
MTIGKELQKQRRAKQLSLEAVSQTLRVDQATLQKIEADDFQGLNPVMVRSCIRQYASLLGLDGAQLLDQFTEPAAAGKDIPAAKPASPVKEKVTEVRAANPAPVKEASPAGKAKEILDKSKVPHGFKAIFKFFDAINLDKLLKIGIWVILGLAVVGSVAGGFNALASKPTSISHSSSSSSSSSPSSSSSSKPAQDDSAKPDENKPSHDDQSSQPSQSQSKEEQVSSSSEASSSSSVASSSSQEQSRQASSSSSQSSTDTTTDTNE